MAVDSGALAWLASDYTKGMTSIRGRRVQRLLKREFAGADEVSIVAIDAGRVAVLGVSASGAAICATDGRGRHASVIRWLHGSAEGVATQFDLLKDSLPALQTESVPVAGLAGLRHLHVASDSNRAALQHDASGTVDCTSPG